MHVKCSQETGSHLLPEHSKQASGKGRDGALESLEKEGRYWVACLFPASALGMAVGNRYPCRSALNLPSAPRVSDQCPQSPGQG